MGKPPVREVEPSTEAGELGETINGMTHSYAWAGTTLTYAFPQAESDYDADPNTAGNQYDWGSPVLDSFSGFNTRQQDVTVDILDRISQFAAVDFVAHGAQHVDDPTLRFGRTNDLGDGLLGQGRFPHPVEGSSVTVAAAGDTWYATDYESAGGGNNPLPGPLTFTERGNFGHLLIMHELGHALGLHHPHGCTCADCCDTDNDGEADRRIPADRDSIEFSAVSYRRTTDSDPNFDFQFNDLSDDFLPQSYMLYDVAALQHIYGARFDEAGQEDDTTYTWSAPRGTYYINGVEQWTPELETEFNLSITNPIDRVGRIFQTIWDGGGVDTYDFSNFGEGIDVDLRPGAWSTVSEQQLADLSDPVLGTTVDARGNIANAYLYGEDTRSLIENAIGGEGDDKIDGNQAENKLQGGEGQDTLRGHEGNDTLIGGADNDSLIGGADDDTLVGGDGADYLSGGTDDDTLDGGTGQDLIEGGEGDDAIVFVRDDDFNSDVNRGGEGVDTIHVRAALLTATDVFDLELGTYATHRFGRDEVWEDFENYDNRNGQGDETVRGNGEANLLVTGSGASRLEGRGGDDTIIGGAGSDSMNGGAGIDIVSWEFEGTAGAAYAEINMQSGEATIVDGSVDTFEAFENVRASQGDDTVTGDDGANVIEAEGGDDTVTAGDGADTVHGGSGDDVLGGGRGADTLSGGDDDDELNGDEDADVLNGGDGADDLYGGSGDDRLTGGLGDDLLDGGAGDGDWVDYSARGTSGTAFGTIRLEGANGAGSFVRGTENDTIVNVENVDGSRGDDTIIGNRDANILMGFAGWDTIRGDGGDDIIWGESGFDRLYGGGGDDFIIGGLGDDTIEGGDQNDELYGEGGFDTIDGGAGADTIHGGDEDDAIAGGEGADIVYGGSGNDGIDGGDQDDWIDGGLDADEVYGGRGSDTLRGGKGRDFVHGGEGDDVIYDDEGKDEIFGGAGSDRVFLHLGDGDRVNGNEQGTSGDSDGATDTIDANEARFSSGTVILGSNGAIKIAGYADEAWRNFENYDNRTGSSSEQVLGSNEANRIDVGSGDNIANGGNANDLINAGDGDDTIAGGQGNDVLNGEGGNDVIYGEEERIVYNDERLDDTISGGEGRDAIRGKEGNDRVFWEGTPIFLKVGETWYDLYDDGDLHFGGAGEDTIDVAFDGRLFDASTLFDLKAGAFGRDVKAWSVAEGVRVDTRELTDEERAILDDALGEQELADLLSDMGGELIRARLDPYEAPPVDDGMTPEPPPEIFVPDEDAPRLDAIYRETWGEFEHYDDLDGYGDERVNGTDGRNVILVGRGDNIVTSGAGNDTVEAAGGDNTIDAGAGHDKVTTADGRDSVSLTVGNDTVRTGAGDDTISVSGSEAATRLSVLDGGDDEDTLALFNDAQDHEVDLNGGSWSYRGDATLATLIDIENAVGGTGDDLLIGNDDANRLNGGSGADELRGGGGGDVLDGGAGFDTVAYGDAKGGVAVYLKSGIASGQGQDTLISIENVQGSGFDDRLAGDAGDNVLLGGAGDDIIKTKGGSDAVYGGEGDDRIVGDAGDELLEGGADDDLIFGLGGVDELRGGDGNDRLYGGRDGDIAHGEDGDDVVRGNLGADVLTGGEGSDRLYGGGSADVIEGGDGRDFIYGENGADRIVGGVGDDNLSGGFVGADDGVRDTFVFDQRDGYDRILDFEVDIDRIDLAGFGFTSFADISPFISAAGSGGANTKIEFGGGNTIYLFDVSATALDAADFIL